MATKNPGNENLYSIYGSRSSILRQPQDYQVVLGGNRVVTEFDELTFSLQLYQIPRWFKVFAFGRTTASEKQSSF